MNQMKLLVTLPLLIFCLHGCKFYYNSADVNKKLKASLDNVNSNCDRLSSQIKNYQTEYLKLNCSNSTSEQKQATLMFDEFNTSLSSMSSFKKTTNEEYAKFLTYTKGKDRIQSGTAEWKSFKNTKKQFKSALKSIQKTGELTVKKAEDLNKFVSEQIAPKIQKCVVADYYKGIKQASDSLNRFEKELPIKLDEYTNKVSKMSSIFQETNPDKCKELTVELSKMKELNKELKLIVNKVKLIERDFLSKTKGVEYIYSCSSDWSLIMKIEQEVKNEQTNLYSLQTKMQTIQTQIQSIVSQLK
jgi:hypothetical protein